MLYSSFFIGKDIPLSRYIQGHLWRLSNVPKEETKKVGLVSYNGHRHQYHLWAPFLFKFSNSVLSSHLRPQELPPLSMQSKLFHT